MSGTQDVQCKYFAYENKAFESFSRCHVSAGERHVVVDVLQETKEAPTSRAHDRQPGSLRFRLQPLGSAVFHHFQVQKNFVIDSSVARHSSRLMIQ